MFSLVNGNQSGRTSVHVNVFKTLAGDFAEGMTELIRGQAGVRVVRH